MTSRNVYWYVAYTLIILPLVLIGWKLNNNPINVNGLLPQETYTLAYEFDLSNLPENTFVKAYLPSTNEHQFIQNQILTGDTLALTLTDKPSGKIGKWVSNGETEAVFQYQLEVTSKAIAYSLADNLPFDTNFNATLNDYLNPSEHIQSTHPLIDSLAQTLKQSDLSSTLKANFDFVSQITKSSTGVLTDALTTLRRNRASCNGKSRLFVALCRAQNIPSRVVGGIILEQTNKRTSHLWASIYYQNQWIPFDVLNQHYAQLPANYLELYTGDNFLITHTKDIDFDYQFVINRQYKTTAAVASNDFQLWSLLNEAKLPLDLLRGLLLLPIIALVVAILRNVVGFKTFGIFLPALIALGLTNVDLWWGTTAFVIVILVVALLHYPLEKFGLLHTPKLVIMMTCVVLTLLGLSILGIQQDWHVLTTSMFLPVIVLSITAERFAKTLVEENLEDALKMLGFTFLLAFICYPMFQANLLMGIVLTYPEVYLIVLGIMILLGRWIGLRVLEYNRFSSFA